METTDRSCPQCSSELNHKLDKFSKESWNVCQCDECSFVYLRNPPEYDALVDDMAWEKTFEIEKERRGSEAPLAKVDKATRWRMSLFRGSKSDLIRKTFGHGKVLDIGCAGGGNLPEPLIPYGIEISRELWKTANKVMQKRGGYAVHAPAVEGITTFENGFFHGILARSFLEHEMNPAKLLQEAYRVLEPGGIMYVRVPNYGSLNRLIMGPQWCGFRYPEHVNYFTSASLKKMAVAAGFHVNILNKVNLYVDDNIKARLTKVA